MHFQIKVKCYTGRLRGGRRVLTPMNKIVVLLMLIHMQVTGFALKSIVFELFAYVHFGSALDQTLGGWGTLSLSDPK